MNTLSNKPLAFELPKDVVTEYKRQRPFPLQKSLCIAPHTSLYFGRNGDITACCLNRKFVLGRYPKDSLPEAWNGERARQMREAIQANALPDGCQACQEQIGAGNFSNTLARSYDRYATLPFGQIGLRLARSAASRPFPQKLLAQAKAEARYLRFRFHQKPLPQAASQAMPRLMEFELSNTCNLECAMCFGDFSSSIRRNREKLPPLPQVYDNRFVKELEGFLPHLWEAKFLGGEPLLIPLYYEIWEAIARLNPGMRVHITTNGTILNRRAEEALRQLNLYLIVSIDSFEPATFEKIRKNARYEQVMDNLAFFDELARAKNSRLTIAASPSILNAREVPDILHRCMEKGWYLFFNTVWFPEVLSLRKLPKKELRELITFYQQHLPGGNGKVRVQNRNALAGLIRQLQQWESNAQ